MNKGRRNFLLSCAAICVVAVLTFVESWLSALSAPAVRLAANPAATFSMLQLAPSSPPPVIEPTLSELQALAALGESKETLEHLVLGAPPEALYRGYKQVRHCRLVRSLEHLADAAEVTSDTTRLQELKSRFGYDSPDQACAGITPRLETEALEWVKAAAEAGIGGAASDFASERPGGDWWESEGGANSPMSRDRVLRLFEKSAEHGDSESLAALARLYSEGRVPLPRGIDGRTRALSYALAWKRSLHTEGLTPIDASASTALATKTIATLESQMSRYQIEQAQVQSRDFVPKNLSVVPVGAARSE